MGEKKGKKTSSFSKKRKSNPRAKSTLSKNMQVSVPSKHSKKRKIKQKYKQEIPKVGCFPFTFIDYLFSCNKDVSNKKSALKKKKLYSKSMSKIQKENPCTKSGNKLKQSNIELLLPKDISLDSEEVSRLMGSFRFSLLVDGSKIPKTLSQLNVLLQQKPELKAKLHSILGEKLHNKNMKSVKELLASETDCSGHQANDEEGGPKKPLERSYSEIILRKQISEKIKIKSHDKNANPSKINNRGTMKKSGTRGKGNHKSNELKNKEIKTKSSKSVKDSVTGKKSTSIRSKRVSRQSIPTSQEISKKSVDLSMVQSTYTASYESVPKNRSLKDKKSRITRRSSKSVNYKRGKSTKTNKGTLRRLYEKLFSSGDSKKVESSSEKENIGKKGNLSKVMEKELSFLSEKNNQELREKYKQWLKSAPKDAKDRFRWEDYVKVMTYVNHLKNSSSKKDEETKKVLQEWLKSFNHEMNNKLSQMTIKTSEEDFTKIVTPEPKSDTERKTHRTRSVTFKDERAIEAGNLKDAVLATALQRRSSAEFLNFGEGQTSLAKMDYMINELLTINNVTNESNDKRSFLLMTEPQVKEHELVDESSRNRNFPTVTKELICECGINENSSIEDSCSDDSDDSQQRDTSFEVVQTSPVSSPEILDSKGLTAWTKSCFNDEVSSAALRIDNVTLEQVKEMCTSFLQRLSSHCSKEFQTRTDSVIGDGTYNIYTMHSVNTNMQNVEENSEPCKSEYYCTNDDQSLAYRKIKTVITCTESLTIDGLPGDQNKAAKEEAVEKVESDNSSDALNLKQDLINVCLSGENNEKLAVIPPLIIAYENENNECSDQDSGFSSGFHNKNNQLSIENVFQSDKKSLNSQIEVLSSENGCGSNSHESDSNEKISEKYEENKFDTSITANYVIGITNGLDVRSSSSYELNLHDEFSQLDKSKSCQSVSSHFKSDSRSAKIDSSIKTDVASKASSIINAERTNELRNNMSEFNIENLANNESSETLKNGIQGLCNEKSFVHILPFHKTLKQTFSKYQDIPLAMLHVKPAAARVKTSDISFETHKSSTKIFEDMLKENLRNSILKSIQEKSNFSSQSLEGYSVTKNTCGVVGVKSSPNMDFGYGGQIEVDPSEQGNSYSENSSSSLSCQASSDDFEDDDEVSEESITHCQSNEKSFKTLLESKLTDKLMRTSSPLRIESEDCASDSENSLHSSTSNGTSNSKLIKRKIKKLLNKGKK